MKIAVVQADFVVGDIEYNANKIITYVRAARGIADIVVFSELALLGYPPMDLLQSKKIVADTMAAANHIADEARDIAVVFGRVTSEEGILYNSAAFACDGRIAFVQHKALLPTYDVFDEHRYFGTSNRFEPFEYMGRKIGLTICEDIWSSAKDSVVFTENKAYSVDPVAQLISAGSEIVINVSASPFVSGKGEFRISFISQIAKQSAVAVVYCNQVGGNDSLVFDGTSFIADKKGRLIALAERFKEDMIVADLEADNRPVEVCFDGMGDLRAALVLGLRDYVRKCGFTRVLLGLSGGIDSALTAVIAAEALGAENVMGITMPSRFSSQGSVDDSVHLAHNLNIKIETLAIGSLHDEFLRTLSPVFSGYDEDVTEENLQARIRGTLLMAMSNKFNALLLTTGNKSELAMGYCTLYGDMSGGLAVISDLPKTTVFELSRYINRDEEIIPRSTIEKPPSAELREDQKDEDSLPPYEVLDEILDDYISLRLSRSEIIAKGFEPEIVDFILKSVDRNEYKRRQ
jgi:NAD+ synthase (glutamine-hydrolysing)